MPPYQPLDLQVQAAVLTLGRMPRDRTLPIFNFVSVPAPANKRVDGAALERLQAVYHGRLIIICGLGNRTLYIVHLCPRRRSLEFVRERAYTLRDRVNGILGLSTCLACKGYNELCDCLPGYTVTPRSISSHAENRAHLH